MQPSPLGRLEDVAPDIEARLDDFFDHVNFPSIDHLRQRFQLVRMTDAPSAHQGRPGISVDVRNQIRDGAKSFAQLYLKFVPIEAGKPGAFRDHWEERVYRLLEEASGSGDGMLRGHRLGQWINAKIEDKVLRQEWPSYMLRARANYLVSEYTYLGNTERRTFDIPFSVRERLSTHAFDL